ncbi:MAG: TIGR03768 family metallophosphoesterase, partial [Hydrogenovibrio sp.]
MTRQDDSKQPISAAFSNMGRRDFLKFSLGTVSWTFLGSLAAGCSSGNGRSSALPRQPIDPNVTKTNERMLSFDLPPQPDAPNSGTGLYKTELPKVPLYNQYGYGQYTYGGQLAIKPRFDIMADTQPDTPPNTQDSKTLRHFFAITDVHITDKEAPNQLIYLQQMDPIYSAAMTSIYSPIMPYTTHVLDAAVQTLNVLHEKTPFDFGISLGDVCNSSQYNELRWYIDVMDGQPIRPSSGDHLGASQVDYQIPYQAAGLNKTIPWYQVLGNHDHFCIGSFAIDDELRESYTSNQVWAVGNVLKPNSGTFPANYNTRESLGTPTYYMGVLDGESSYGKITHTANYGDAPPATIAADPNRRPLHRTEWMQEFFNTDSEPRGHGFNHLDPTDLDNGFACYSFIPNQGVPLKVIVLDNTQSDTDGSQDIHGHGFLDEKRWNWLKTELKAGQDNDQLMIIAAHIPIAVAAIGSAMEWWESDKDPNATEQNAVTLAELVATLQDAPNLLMWIAGHRHLNTVKAFVSPDPVNKPERGFWQVETASLRDFPQQ